MYLMIFGLLCMCFASFGRTQMPSEATIFIRELYQDEDEMESIFSMEDGTIQREYKIMFPELKEEKQQFDSNDHNIISPDEHNDASKQLDAFVSSDEELYFVDLDLNDDSGPHGWFGEFYQDYDNMLSPDELSYSLQQHDVFVNSEEEFYFADLDLNDDSGHHGRFRVFVQEYATKHLPDDGSQEKEEDKWDKLLVFILKGKSPTQV